MEPGKDGFCVATFPGEKPFVTEVPNVLLKKSSTAEHTGRDKGMKRPATAAALSSKRPAPALQEPAPDHAAAATHELQAEGELPVSCLKYFFLISIAIQPASDFLAQTLPPSIPPSLLIFPFPSFILPSFLGSSVWHHGAPPLAGH